MRKKVVIYVLLIIGITLIINEGCSQGGNEEQLVKLDIKGMTCDHCVANVTKALQSVEGVDTAIVDLENDKAEVRFKENAPMTEALIAAVEKAGYGASIIED
jgi:P-type Cu+ transporter